MANVVESVRITDKARVPEELAEFEGLAKDEHNKLVGVDEAGNTRIITGLGDLVMKMALETGVAEEVEPEDELTQLTPEIRALVEGLVKEQTTDLTKRLDTVEKERDELNKKIEELEAQLSEAASRGLNGFEIRDEVELKQADGEFKPGFKVVGFDQEGDQEYILVKDEETRLITSVQPSNIKKIEGSDPVADPVILDPPADPIASPADRRRAEVKQPLTSRIRSRFFGGPGPREYYIDDGGRYYVIEDDQEVYVDPPTDKLIGAVAVGAVVGVAIWELVGERIFGFGEGGSHQLKEVINNQAIEINKLNGVNEHLTSVNQHIHRELWHGHSHDLRAIHGLHNQIARDHAQEIHTINGLKKRINESNSVVAYKAAFRYPWDWATYKVGNLRAETWLHTLATRAAQHGHKVRWFSDGFLPNGAKKEILQIDGTTNTSSVVRVLNQYQ